MRALKLFSLCLLVLAVHLGLADGVLPDRLGEGFAASRPVRMNVSFVRQLQAADPPPVAATRLMPRMLPALRVARPETAASAAQAALAESVSVVPPALLELLAQAPVLTVAEESAAAPPAASSPAPVNPPTPASTFEWPPSTRLTYRLTGNYRGPVEGQASVEWLRTDSRYQVVMDLSIGPAFAPLMSRRVSSSGEITAQGLRPQRYDEETQVIFRAPRRLQMEMGDLTVQLANGRQSERPPGLQDSASQFVQLTWLFTTQPDLLQAGRSIELPLALPRTVEPWIYDVLGTETLRTPAGEVSAVHVKPRREPKPGGDLTPEIWVAPSLQYLPVRILIRQDDKTWIDLNIDRPPEQAAPGK